MEKVWNLIPTRFKAPMIAKICYFWHSPTSGIVTSTVKRNIQIINQLIVLKIYLHSCQNLCSTHSVLPDYPSKWPPSMDKHTDQIPAEVL